LTLNTGFLFLISRLLQQTSYKLFLLFCLFFLGCIPQSKGDTSSFEHCISGLEKDYAIKIVYKQPDSVFYSSWREPPMDAHSEPIDIGSGAVFCKTLKEALGNYPKKVISESLSAIAISKRLYLYGQLYGATYAFYDERGKGDLFIANFSDQTSTDNRLFVLDSFHHEFSSILLKKFNFPVSEWRKINPKNFQYVYETKENPGTEALKEGFKTEEETALLKIGFLSQYSTSDLEEDFNTFAGMVFSQPEHIIELANTYPAIKSKTEALLRFYGSFAPDFMKTTLFKFYITQGFKLD
jgi:hypothetical protein